MDQIWTMLSRKPLSYWAWEKMRKTLWLALWGTVEVIESDIPKRFLTFFHQMSPSPCWSPNSREMSHNQSAKNSQHRNNPLNLRKTKRTQKQHEPPPRGIHDKSLAWRLAPPRVKPPNNNNITTNTTSTTWGSNRSARTRPALQWRLLRKQARATMWSVRGRRRRTRITRGIYIYTNISALLSARNGERQGVLYRMDGYFLRDVLASNVEERPEKKSVRVGEAKSYRLQ